MWKSALCDFILIICDHVVFNLLLFLLENQTSVCVHRKLLLQKAILRHFNCGGVQEMMMMIIVIIAALNEYIS